MRIILAYISVILLWATTPLAIKWSGEGAGFLFGVTSRMSIGTVCVLVMLAIMRRGIPWHRQACLLYLATAVQIYGAMLAVYWAAQYVPSGWISVIFGLTPLMTAILAALILGERSLTVGKLLAYSLGVGGLAIMFGSALQVGHEAVLGISGVLISVLLQALSAVLIKRLATKIPALSQLAGGLLFALPAYFLSWGIADGHWPSTLTPRNIAAIVYLGVIATTLGFLFYYYLLAHLSATRVALITLVSPVMALFLGHLINHEALSIKVLTGTGCILSALILHEFFDRLLPVNAKDLQAK